MIFYCKNNTATLIYLVLKEKNPTTISIILSSGSSIVKVETLGQKF